jgi:glutathione synthase
LNEGILKDKNILKTLLVQNSDAIRTVENFLSKFDENSEFVAKPWDGHAGYGVQFLKDKKDVLNFFQKISSPFLLQPALSEVKTLGDKRIFAVNGKIEFWFTRIPTSGKIVSNLAQGGKAQLCEISVEHMKMCSELALWLKKKGIYLAGIDMIGEIVNEINITSPTGIRTFESLTKTTIHEKIFNSLWGAIETEF